MIITFACARCARSNPPALAFCAGCGLPLGTAQADAAAARDALGSYEAPDPSEGDASPAARDLATRSGFEATPFGHGWRVVIPLPLDRVQAVYLGHDGTDAEGRPLLGIVSVCGPANDRDARVLLKLNARAVDGHFAIKPLRGEEYFVVSRTILAEASANLDASALLYRIAQAADGLEERLSRGRDLY